MLFAPLGVVIAVVSGAARWNWHSVVLLMLTDLMPEEPQQGVIVRHLFRITSTESLS